LTILSVGSPLAWSRGRGRRRCALSQRNRCLPRLRIISRRRPCRLLPRTANPPCLRLNRSRGAELLMQNVVDKRTSFASRKCDRWMTPLCIISLTKRSESFTQAGIRCSTRGVFRRHPVAEQRSGVLGEGACHRLPGRQGPPAPPEFGEGQRASVEPPAGVPIGRRPCRKSPRWSAVRRSAPASMGRMGGASIRPGVPREGTPCGRLASARAPDGAPSTPRWGGKRSSLGREAAPRERDRLAGCLVIAV
jgi:hypothetical protein